MNKVFFLIILLTYVLSATAQDVIVGTSGKNIYYKVIKVDYSDVYYYLNDDIFKHSISRNDVKKIQYGSQFPNSSIKGSHFNLNEPKSSITVGLLEGGGSLIGFDLEMMYSKSASIQL